MEWIQLPDEFKELLRLLHSNHAKYLIVGGFAVIYHGYPRTTADIDIWLPQDSLNAERVISALRQHGFSDHALDLVPFAAPDQIVRIGVAPLRVEFFTTIPGVEFQRCFARRSTHVIDGIPVSILGLEDLRISKQASGRLKDLNDLEHLRPPPKPDPPLKP
jgi:predicted nucleotidyltransferase